MENKKMTKVEALEGVMAVFRDEVRASDELVEKIENMLEQEKKVASRKKKGVSKVSKEKVADAEKIVEKLAELDTEDFLSSQEIDALCEFGYTPQKMTPRLKYLVEEGVLIKGQATSDKKKVGYQYISGQEF